MILLSFVNSFYTKPENCPDILNHPFVCNGKSTENINATYITLSMANSQPVNVYRWMYETITQMF